MMLCQTCGWPRCAAFRGGLHAQVMSGSMSSEGGRTPLDFCGGNSARLIVFVFALRGCAVDPAVDQGACNEERKGHTLVYFFGTRRRGWARTDNVSNYIKFSLETR